MENWEHTRKTDYIFPRYPLWVRYSELPEKLGPGPWCVFQRLLELVARFGSNEFHYSLIKLRRTCGIRSEYGLKKILERLKKEKLIHYKTHHGRGKETDFWIIFPLNTPLSEEEVYIIHPRLRSQSYREKVKNGLLDKNPNGVEVLAEREENPNGVGLLLNENSNGVGVLDVKNSNGVGLLLNENPNGVGVLRNKVGVFEKNGCPETGTTTEKNEGQKIPHEKERKKYMYKKDNNNKNDLSHEKDENPSSAKVGDNETAMLKIEEGAGSVVVDSNINTLKEYGISGDDAEKFVRTYSETYLSEKIEIIDYKKHSGETIRNIGGMLKKAIIEDWQPPTGFTTRAQREEASRKKKESTAAAIREERTREEKEKQEQELARAAEEWKKTAPKEELEKIRERARQVVLPRFPDTDESLIRIPIRLAENKIIAEEYLTGEA